MPFGEKITCNWSEKSSAQRLEVSQVQVCGGAETFLVVIEAEIMPIAASDSSSAVLAQVVGSCRCCCVSRWVGRPTLVDL